MTHTLSACTLQTSIRLPYDRDRFQVGTNSQLLLHRILTAVFHCHRNALAAFLLAVNGWWIERDREEFCGKGGESVWTVFRVPRGYSPNVKKGLLRRPLFQRILCAALPRPLMPSIEILDGRALPAMCSLCSILYYYLPFTSSFVNYYSQ